MSGIKPTPIEAFNDLKTMTTFLTTRYLWPDKKHIPGLPVLEASAETREALKKLKSSDLANIRPDAIFGSNPHKRK